MPYDPQNVFAKILRRELPCEVLYEDEFALAFPDLHRQAPCHVLVIPKRASISFADFASLATAEEITGFFRAVALVAERLGVREPGYRLIANIGPDSHSEVPHFHVHILAGAKLGPLLTGS